MATALQNTGEHIIKLQTEGDFLKMDFIMKHFLLMQSRTVHSVPLIVESTWFALTVEVEQ